MNLDEIEPQKTQVKPLDLSTLSVSELEVYVKNLTAEIARAQTIMQQKQKHRSAVEGLFKT